jgi:hypothetical protein
LNSKALFLALGASEVDCAVQNGQLRKKKKKLEKQFGEKRPELMPIPHFCFSEWPIITSMAMVVLEGFGGTRVATDLTQI